MMFINGLESWCLWIIGMFSSAVWTLILTAPIHCRGSIGEWCNAHNLFWWRKNSSIFWMSWGCVFIFWWTVLLKASHPLAVLDISAIIFDQNEGRVKELRAGCILMQEALETLKLYQFELRVCVTSTNCSMWSHPFSITSPGIGNSFLFTLV